MDERGAARTADRSAQVRDAPVFVLIHSPLLPPTSWSLVARDLQRRGHEAVVPSLRGLVSAAEPRWWYARSATRAATAGIDSPVILVAHSAAGRLLPTIARALPNDVAALLFVDARLPPAMGSATLAPAWLQELVRALERDGLKPSSSWFRQEIPLDNDPAGRALTAMMQERPRLPLSYFQERVPMPKDWIDGRCAYVCLSDAYAADVSQAQAYGWPVAAIHDGHHLSLVTDPEAVTSALLELAHEVYPIAPDPGNSAHRGPAKYISAQARSGGTSPRCCFADPSVAEAALRATAADVSMDRLHAGDRRSRERPTRQRQVITRAEVTPAFDPVHVRGRSG